jgi:hypothetical protein
MSLNAHRLVGFDYEPNYHNCDHTTAAPTAFAEMRENVRGIRARNSTEEPGTEEDYFVVLIE